MLGEAVIYGYLGFAGIYNLFHGRAPHRTILNRSASGSMETENYILPSTPPYRTILNLYCKSALYDTANIDYHTVCSSALHCEQLRKTQNNLTETQSYTSEANNVFRLLGHDIHQ